MTEELGDQVRDVEHLNRVLTEKGQECQRVEQLLNEEKVKVGDCSGFGLGMASFLRVNSSTVARYFL